MFLFQKAGVVYKVGKKQRDRACVCPVSFVYLDIFYLFLLKASQEIYALVDKFIHHLVVLHKVYLLSVLAHKVFYLFGGLQACHLLTEVERLCRIEKLYCQHLFGIVHNAVKFCCRI